MAGLLNEEVQRIFKERPGRKEIETGIKHHERLKFHSETVTEKNQLSPYYLKNFLPWISSEKPELLPKDKVERFKQLITVPLPTTELTESIYSHFSNIFKGQDKFFRYDFKNPEYEDDWLDYVDYSFWEVQGFEAMKTAIDSVWVLDLASEQTTERPEPKDKLIDINDIVSIKCDIYNNCEYVIFLAGDRIYEYDSEFIRVYEFKRGTKDIKSLPEREIVHGLGYTPARMFWSEKLLKDNFINKKSPITNALGDLDWFLACHVFKKYMEIGNSYPILASYQDADDYLGSRQEEDRGRTEDEKRPSGADLVGPGTFITVKSPIAGEPDQMENPIKFINPDVANLQYHDGAIEKKREIIFLSCVGKNEEATKEAVNEKQVMSAYESQTVILLQIARNFKLIQEFAEKCKCDIRYGVGELISISIDYGTKFFLRSAGDLIEDLATAKENGSHTSVVGALMNEILEAKYRNDKKGLSRAQILQELDPLPDKTQEEAEKILAQKGITSQQYVIKSNLLSFANRFEREQVSLTEFASARPYSVKIAYIQEEFEKYADEILGMDEEGEKTPSADDIAKTALNGAQVSSLLEVVGNVTSGVISKESAKQILAAAFPFFTSKQIKGIIDKLEINGKGVNPPKNIINDQSQGTAA